MTRKIGLTLISAIVGAVITLVATHPDALVGKSNARAASSDVYRQLNLFGNVFEHVRANYVVKPNDSN